jgi:hypothetical protein
VSLFGYFGLVLAARAHAEATVPIARERPDVGRGLGSGEGHHW